jgi:hypothetical protein
MGVSLINETTKPTIVRDQIGIYCIRDIPCFACERNGTRSCPNGKNSKVSYSTE